MAANDGNYEVMWPRGQKTMALSALAPRLGDLNGKTVCQLWDYLFRGDEIFPMIEDALRAQYPDVKFVRFDEFGSTHGDEERDVIEALHERVVP